MNSELQQRLNQIQEKITSEEFLTGKRLGGDLSFWIFDYAPQHELQVRDYIEFLKQSMSQKQANIKLAHVDLLKLVSDYLRERNFLDKSFQMEKRKGSEDLLSALKGPIHTDKLTPYLVDTIKANEQDVVIVSGIGSVWPVLRAHNLLNSLHARFNKPFVLFYPGGYDGQTLSLFNRLKNNHYYRAFRLVP